MVRMLHLQAMQPPPPLDPLQVISSRGWNNSSLNGRVLNGNGKL